MRLLRDYLVRALEHGSVLIIQLEVSCAVRSLRSGKHREVRIEAVLPGCLRGPGTVEAAVHDDCCRLLLLPHDVQNLCPALVVGSPVLLSRPGDNNALTVCESLGKSAFVSLRNSIHPSFHRVAVRYDKP